MNLIRHSGQCESDLNTDRSPNWRLIRRATATSKTVFLASASWCQMKISLEMTGIGSYIVMAVAKPKSIRTEQIILEDLTPDEELA